MLGDDDEAEHLKFEQRRPDRTAPHAIALKVIVCDRQLAVILPAVVSEFNFDARERAMGRQA
jgi:hypothetical protein